jgi:hypothetical protein
MSALDDLIDTKIEADFQPPPEKVKKALPKGKAKATLVEYAAARDVVGKESGQIWAIKPAVFLVEGTPYNDEVERPSLRIRFDVWVAMTEDGKYDMGKIEGGDKAGQDKNASMARFFKAFGRSTQGTSWNDLVGSDCTLGFAPEIDNRTGEPTGYLKGTWVGKAE